MHQQLLSGCKGRILEEKKVYFRDEIDFIFEQIFRVKFLRALGLRSGKTMIKMYPKILEDPIAQVQMLDKGILLLPKVINIA